MGRKALCAFVLLALGTQSVLPPRCTSAQPNAATGSSDSVKLTLISDEFDIPVQITTNPFRPDEIIVVERDGLAKRLLKSDHSVKEILDIEILVHGKHPHGLMSLAYSNKVESGHGEFFVNYIDTQGDLVIGRFPDTKGKLVDDEQLSVVLKVARITPNSHGSQILTHTDGSLFITTGDGEESPQSPSHAAQSTKSLLGKVLRIEPQKQGGYTSPSSNPLPRAAGNLAEIWALGFRNPESATLDTGSGELFVIDNGPQWLEVNVVQPGKNYGWDIVEGSECRAAPCSLASYTAPVVKIQRASPHSKLIGGVLYRGKNVPALTGSFIFGENSSGAVFAARKNSDSSWHYSVIATIPKKEISAIGADAAGEIIIATRDGFLFEVQ